ncbi:hypothetical protein R1sor_027246 [Riccia sorocarpa]|uniref:COMM domain-containing protein n=1 Tax=Riccia sorocarpa TaxID=122646 RepID=A0ABD3GDQ2_9MARC
MEPDHEDEVSELVVASARQLLDFDWKLRYVVCSETMASVNRPLLRLELAVSNASVKVGNVPYFRKESVEEKAQVALAEYSKVELDNLISQMEAINQVPFKSQTLSLLPVEHHQNYHYS